jgi:hypothetical protein
MHFIIYYSFILLLHFSLLPSLSVRCPPPFVSFPTINPPTHPPNPTTTQQQVSEFLFGEGFAITGGDQWRVRRKAVGPALHRGYLEAMLARVFCPCSERLADALDAAAAAGAPVDMEARLWF